jgi:hypothetical protein
VDVLHVNTRTLRAKALPGVGWWLGQAGPCAHDLDPRWVWWCAWGWGVTATWCCPAAPHQDGLPRELNLLSTPSPAPPSFPSQPPRP